MKVHLILLVTPLLSGFPGARTEGTPPPATGGEKLKKSGNIFSWNKATQLREAGF